MRNTHLLPVFSKLYESWHLSSSLYISLSGSSRSCTEMEALICSFEFMSDFYCQSLKSLNFCHFSSSLPPPPYTSQQPLLLFLGLYSVQPSFLSGSLWPWPEVSMLVWWPAPQYQLQLQEILSLKLRLKGEEVGAHISWGYLLQSTSLTPSWRHSGFLINHVSFRAGLNSSSQPGITWGVLGLFVYLFWHQSP